MGYTVNTKISLLSNIIILFNCAGALGLGLKQIPSLLDKQKKVSDMKGGISLGGEDLPVNFIATLGYPEPLKIKDVENVIAKVNLKDVYDLGPKRSFMAKSMLERDGMMSAMSDCNPLAVYAVFEAFSGQFLKYIPPSVFIFWEILIVIVRWRRRLCVCSKLK